MINTDHSLVSKQQLFPGVWRYTNIFTKELNLVERLESQIKTKWESAKVGDNETILDYRDCLDFKMSELGKDSQLYKDVYNVQSGPVKDYCDYHNIVMNYWEWTNVVKYGVGQHFQEHADHGWSYISTVSLVGYPNDDYEGGELYFPKLGLNIKPEAGDLYIFPSTYLFSHIAMPVVSGTKYSLVTMLDYNDNTHTEEYELYTEKKYKEMRNL